MRCKHCQGELRDAGTVGVRAQLRCADCGHAHLVFPEDGGFPSCLVLCHDSDCCDAVRQPVAGRAS